MSKIHKKCFRNHLIFEKINSQASERTWVPCARCARSGPNGQAVVRTLQNFHERFRRCLKPQLNSEKIIKLEPNFWFMKMCFRVFKRNTIETKAKIYKYLNTINSIIFLEKFHIIIMTSTMILRYWQYFHKIRKVWSKGIFFHRFDIAVHAEPWELKNTLMCQLWHVERLRVNLEDI